MAKRKVFPSDIDKKVSEYDRFYGAQDFNPGTRSVKLPVEVKHSYFNHHFIYNDIKRGTGADVQSVNVNQQIPALIMGSGPTFDEFAPYLKDWKGAIFASTSQVPTCIYHGHAPEYIVALDPHSDLPEIEGVDDWNKYDSKLICHPCISPRLVQEWPLKRLYYRPMEPSSEFHAMNLGIAYGEVIQTYCLLFSCTPAAQVALARMMGYHPIYLVGLDFGFPAMKRRFTSWYYHELAGWQVDRPLTLDENDDSFRTENPFRRLIYTENGCCSSVMHVYYKRAFICVANIDMSDIFKLKEFNALTEFPEITAEELIKTQGKVDKSKLWSRAKKQRIYEDYLARYYTFALRYKDGSLSYFECTPEIEKYEDRMPAEVKQRMKKGEKLDIDEQIRIFVTQNFNNLKASQVQVRQKLAKSPEDLLNPIAEIKRLQELNHRAKAYRDNIHNRK